MAATRINILDEESPIQSGYLFKKGLYRTKLWKRRKFFFDPQKDAKKLFYERDTAKERKLFKVIKVPTKIQNTIWDENTKSIDVTSVRSVMSESLDDIPEAFRANGFCLNILDASGKPKKVLLYAETPQDKRRWIYTIEKWVRDAEKKDRQQSQRGSGYSGTYVN